jgi:hypothetical protein
MDKSGFSSACKQELEDQIAHRVGDFKLDTALREACEDDLKDSCAATLEQVRGRARFGVRAVQRGGSGVWAGVPRCWSRC